MTRVRELHNKWCEENKHFFKKDKVKPECTQQAKQALMTYLRKNNVTITETQLTLTEYSHSWDISMYFVSCIIGAIIGALFSVDNVVALIIWSVIYVVLLFPILKWIVWKNTNSLNESSLNLLRIALESYQEIYANEMNNDTKSVELWNGKHIEIPCRAEELYEQQMQQPRYYRQAYLISIHNGAQLFEYVWYTNTKYKKLHSNTYHKFLDICEEQIGIKWHDIDMTKIEMKDLTHRTSPTS